MRVAAGDGEARAHGSRNAQTETLALTQAYPLAWPDGWKRTSARDRRRSLFKVTPDKARKNLQHQLELLGATPWTIVISSNVALRQDGQPYADMMRRSSWDDPGVAVYFELDSKRLAMARDIYLTPHENMHALGHAIEHMRGLERHGGWHMVERAFTGFAALPPPTSKRDWWDVLGVQRSASRDDILAAHRKLIASHHPDRGGSHDAMAEINAARDAGLKERTLS